MNELYRIFGIKWKRPLKWYDKLLIIWASVAICGLQWIWTLYHFGR